MSVKGTLPGSGGLAVVTTFYEQLPQLELVLAGLARQSEREFEIIVADDGSREETRAAALRLIAAMPIRTSLVTHPRGGWQKNRILNRAILSTEASQLVFMDGDVVPHRHFVRAHKAAIAPTVVTAGRRVMLSKRRTSALTMEAVRAGRLESPWAAHWDALTAGGRHAEESVYLPFRWARAWRNAKPSRGVVGCNFGVHRSDLMAINGFEMRFRTSGIGEDTEIERRLRSHGARIVSLRNDAIQFHLWHVHRPNEANPEGWALLQETERTGRVRAVLGLEELHLEMQGA